MIPPSVLRYLPYVALSVGVVLFSLLLRWTIVRHRLYKRPLLFVWMVVGALPALYVGLVWCGFISDVYLRLARPWATLLALGGTAYVALRLNTVLRRQGRWRARLSDFLASLAVFTAAMAVSGPELGRPLDRLTILIAVDRSRSIDLVPHADKRVVQELSVAELGMREDDKIGTIVFAAEAATEDPPRPKSQLGSPQRVVLGRDGTDIAAGIRRALAEVPSDSAARIVLLTDGVATRGDTMAAAAAAVAIELPIDVVVLEQKMVPDVRVVALRAPSRVDEGEALDLRLVTSSPAPAEVEIRLHRDGQLIAKADAAIAAGEDVLRIREKAPEAGLHRYDVEITAKDTQLDQAAEDNTGSTFIRVRGPTSALVLEGEAGKGAFIAKSLENAAFRVQEGSTSSVPGDLGGLAGFDLVVLSDIRASDISPDQIDALASYVRDFGGGLVLMGGDRSMGPGGYAKTALEEVSPVSFDLKQEHRRASLAEVIGIDISGSMGAQVGAHTKLELANEAAARSAALLGAGDMLGVEHVDTTVHWSVPLGPVTDKAAIDKAIRGVGPGGGGIYVNITLEAAYTALVKTPVNLKHVLLLADGDDADEIHLCPPMVANAYQQGITTSVVALGNGKDVAELERLSHLGSGRFYLIEDASRLPAVFTQETVLAARSAIVEKPFSVKQVAQNSIMAGIAFDQAPELRGYVVTIPKSRATVLLSGPEGDPILAVWPAGVGRAAAFTSDLKDRWGVNWTGWAGAARLVAQVGRDVARKAEDPRVRLESDTAGGQLSIRATVVGDDGRAQSFRRLMVHVAGPDGFLRQMPLEATGPGAYTATLPLSRPGTYMAVAKDELTSEVLGTTGSIMTAGEELRPTGSDLALLGRIAEFTGGKKRDTLAGIFADRATKRFSYKDATPPLVLLAAFGLLLSVAARRLAVPEVIAALPGRLKARWQTRQEKPIGSGQPDPQATVEALIAARDKTRAERTADKDKKEQEAARTGVQAIMARRQRPMTPAAPPMGQTGYGPYPAAMPYKGRVERQATATRPSGQQAGTGPVASGPPSQGRPLTAAEKILLRRRGKT